MDGRLFIGGRWCEAAGGRTSELVNPATEERICAIPEAKAEDAHSAVEVAASALPAWAAAGPYNRAQVLERAAEYITTRVEAFARITTEESGKPIAQARAEWAGAPNYLRWAAAEACRLYGRIIPARSAGRRIDVSYVPLGVVGVITAWNFPVYNQVRALSAALAAGCTVVSKPSEYTPRSALLLAEALAESGLPAGVLNVIYGDAAEIGAEMLADARVRKIHFTGSTRVGKLLIEGSSRTVTRLSLELGGNAPAIIFPDAGDLQALAEQASSAKLRNCGQVCIAPQRFYVHADAVEAFLAGAIATARAQVTGNGLDAATTVGPLINAAQRERVERIVNETLAAGARLEIGGNRPSQRGYFYLPTVLSGITPGMPLHEEEVFGPVMAVMPFTDLDEVITLANAVEHGLSAYLFTSDLATAHEVSERLEYGIVGVNEWMPVAPEAPFGGMKQSGIGRESGMEGLHEYVEARTRFFGGLA